MLLCLFHVSVYAIELFCSEKYTRALLVNMHSRILCCNIRGLEAALPDLSVASDNYNITCCYETLVCSMRHTSEPLIHGFNKPLLLNCKSVPRAHGILFYINIRCRYNAHRPSCMSKDVMKLLFLIFLVLFIFLVYIGIRMRITINVTVC